MYPKVTPELQQDDHLHVPMIDDDHLRLDVRAYLVNDSMLNLVHSCYGVCYPNAMDESSE